jgi:hypothetical protein
VSSGLLVPPEQDRVAVRLQYGGANREPRRAI